MRRNIIINLGFILANLAMLVFFLWPPGMMAREIEFNGSELEPPRPWADQGMLSYRQEALAPVPLEPAATLSASPGLFRRLPTQDRVVALTFDDGPKGTVRELLAILEEKNVPATFFLLGTNALNSPGLVHRIAAAGHDIGNHSWSHPNLKGMDKAKIFWQIESCTLVFEALDVTMQPFMRPPYGSRDSTVLEVTAQLGYHIILWDVDTRDWQFDDPAVVLERALAGLKPGSIVLFHDGPAVTLAVLPLFIDEALARGYRFVLVSEYIQ